MTMILDLIMVALAVVALIAFVHAVEKLNK